MVRFPTWAGILIAGLFLSFSSAFAFTVPTVSPGVGGGSLQLDTSGNLGVGTSSSTPISTFNSTSTESGPNTHGKVFMVASSTNPGIGLKNLTSGNTYLWSARNFGNLQLYRESATYPGLVVIDINQFGDVAIGTSTASAGNPSRLTVGGSISANSINATLTGAVPASGVTNGTFSSGNFAFQNSLGIGTTSIVGLPANLYVNGSGRFDGSVTFRPTGGSNPAYPNQIGVLDATNYNGQLRMTMAGGTDFWWVTGTSTADNGILEIATGDNANEPITFVQYNGGTPNERMRITNTGNLAIGTTVASTTLTVGGDVLAQGGNVLFGDNGTSNREYISSFDSGLTGINSAGVFGLFADASLGGSAASPSAGLSAAGIYSSGKVGIGTTTPISPLHVLGSTTITDDVYLSDNKSIRLDSAAATTLLIGNYSSGGFTYGSGAGTASLAVEGDVKGNRLCFGDSDCQTSWSGIVASGGGNYWVNSGSSLYPSSTSWNVGIGTNSPTTTLHLVKTSAGTNTYSVLLKNNNSTANTETGIFFDPTSASPDFIRGAAITAINNGSNQISLKFTTGDAGVITEKLRITHAGNVGIGTTTPSNKLTISDGTSGVTPLQRIENYSTGDAAMTFAITGVQAYSIGVDNSDSDKFKIGGNATDVGLTNFLTIDTSGNIGIGTTTPATELHVVSPSGNAATFSAPITVGYPVTTTDAARKDYVDANFAPIGGSAGVWIQSSSNLYPSSTSWNIGVGISSSINSKLHVSGTVGLIGAIGTTSARPAVSTSSIAGEIHGFDSNNSVGSDGGLLRLSAGGGTGSYKSFIDLTGYNNTGTDESVVVLGTRSTERIRITNTGDVGIGTSTPTVPLTVKGTTRLYDSTFARYIELIPQTSVQHIRASAGDLYINYGSGGNLYFYGGNTVTAAMSVTTNGNLVASGTIVANGNNLRIGTASTTLDQWTQVHDVAGDRMYMGFNGSQGGDIQFYANGTSNGSTQRFSSNGTGYFGGTVTIGYPVASTDAARKDYVDTNFAPIGGASGIWVNSGSYLYPSSTTWSVGIGTSTPYGKLHVAGIGYSDQNTNVDSITSPTTTTAGGLVLDGSYSDGRYRTRLVKIDRGGNLPLYIQDSYGSSNVFNNVARFGSHSYSTNKFEVYGSAAFSGNLGLGTTTAPGGILDAIGTSAGGNVLAYIRNTSNTSNSGARIATEVAGTSAGNPYYSALITGGNSWSWGADNADSDSFKIGVGTTLTAATKLTINASGNVGIGTTTPSSNLHISASSPAIRLQDTVSASSSGVVDGYIVFTDSANSQYGYIGDGSTGNNNIDVYGGTTHGVSLFGGGIRALTVDTSGNVGIGTTTPSTQLHVVAASGNAATFSAPITVGYPVATTDAARKDYVDSNFAPIGGSSGVWRLSGSNVYPSSTSYNVGIGLTNPAAPLNVYATTSLATSTETIRLSAPQNYTAGFGPKLSFWNGASEQLALITGSIQTTSNGNFGRLDFGTRTSDALGVETKVSILASGNLGVGTTTPANRLTVVGGNISIQPSQVIGSGLTFDSSGSAASSSIELYNGSTGDMTLRTGYVNGDILLLPRANVGIGTTTPSTKLEVVAASGNAATFSAPITVGYPVVSTDAARKDYVDAAVTSGNASSSKACNADATCEITNADFGGTGNITGVNKLTVTTIDPLYEIKGKKYSTYASAIAGGVKEEYVGRGEMKKISGNKWQMVLDFDSIADGSDLWVWKHTVDFSGDSVEVLVTPIGSPVPMAYEIKNNKVIFSAQSKDVVSASINFSYRLIGKRVDWREWPTFAKDQSEKTNLIIK